MVFVGIVLSIIVGLNIFSFIYDSFDKCREKADRENFLKDWREGKKYAEFYRD